MNITIVPIAEEHIEGFHAALDIICRELIYLAFNQAPPLESTRQFVRNNIRNNVPQFVALSDGKVIGWCDISPKSNRDTNKHVGVLGIGVIPAFRGQGVGRPLMETAIDKGFKNGLKRIELDVRENNVNAIALYKKLGFDIEGLKKGSSFVKGEYINDYIMARLK